MELGRTGEKLSPIGLGTWQWGSRAWGWMKGYGQEDVEKAFHRALDLGLNLFDTAEIYGGGRSETVLGGLLKQRPEEAFVATKVLPWRVRHSSMRRAAEASRRRLGVDAIDLYQLHFPNPLVPLSRIVRSMERLVKDGTVRHLGLSNVGVAGLEKAREALSREDIASVQVQYNLIRRKPERSLLEYCHRESITLLAYSPLAQGALTGKYSLSSPPRDTIRAVNAIFAPPNFRRLGPSLRLLSQIAASRDVTPAQVALNWLMSTPQVIPIPGVKTVGHVEDASAATDFKLTAAQKSELDAAFKDLRISRLVAAPWSIGRLLRSAIR